jgi:hypothetical protein
MPVSFDHVFADGAFVGFGPFDPVHVSSSRQMVVVRKFDDEDLGSTVLLQSFKCLLTDGPAMLMDQKALRLCVA